MTRDTTPPAPQSGRPRLLDAEAMATFRSLYSGHVRTDRGLQNKYYIGQALSALGITEESPPCWLWDAAASRVGKQGAIKWGVLEQLGRIAVELGEDTARDIAAEVEKYPWLGVKRHIQSLGDDRLKLQRARRFAAGGDHRGGGGGEGGQG
jgi:hypothetical protein